MWHNTLIGPRVSVEISPSSKDSGYYLPLERSATITVSSHQIQSSSTSSTSSRSSSFVDDESSRSPQTPPSAYQERADSVLSRASSIEKSPFLADHGADTPPPEPAAINSVAGFPTSPHTASAPAPLETTSTTTTTRPSTSQSPLQPLDPQHYYTSSPAPASSTPLSRMRRLSRRLSTTSASALLSSHPSQTFLRPTTPTSIPTPSPPVIPLPSLPTAAQLERLNRHSTLASAAAPPLFIPTTTRPRSITVAPRAASGARRYTQFPDPMGGQRCSLIAEDDGGVPRVLQVAAGDRSAVHGNSGAARLGEQAKPWMDEQASPRVEEQARPRVEEQKQGKKRTEQRRLPLPFVAGVVTRFSNLFARGQARRREMNGT